MWFLTYVIDHWLADCEVVLFQIANQRTSNSIYTLHLQHDILHVWKQEDLFAKALSSIKDLMEQQFCFSNTIY